MFRMPGKSYAGPLPPLSEREEALHRFLMDDVRTLAVDIGERHLHRYDSLLRTRDFIEAKFAEAGLQVGRQSFEVEGRACDNVVAEIGKSSGDAIFVIGAHYDTVPGCPGANDNASGVAALLALARAFREPLAGYMRFVAFVNEEPPHFRTRNMGSLVYARHCRRRGDRIAGMLSLETIGYYSDRPGSQRYPFPVGLFYPNVGNFIAFVSNWRSRHLLRAAVAAFRERARFPSEGGALPGFIPGVGWSDHWAFWCAGYPAVMLTDTAPFRYPFYHSPLDTPERIDFERLARVVAGLEAALPVLVERLV